MKMKASASCRLLKLTWQSLLRESFEQPANIVRDYVIYGFNYRRKEIGRQGILTTAKPFYAPF